MSKKSKAKPALQTEEEVREYWTDHDSADYLDWSKAESVTFPNLKPSTQTISIRLTKSLLKSIRLEANKRDVPYQSLIKIWLQEKLDSLPK
jgi:predicted DNA binding CopG/RHH family protein